VHDHHERVTVTVHGRLSAVLVAVEDLERLEETLAILRDAGTMDRLAESGAELRRGEPVSAAELAETMRRRSLAVGHDTRTSSKPSSNAIGQPRMRTERPKAACLVQTAVRWVQTASPALSTPLSLVRRGECAIYPRAQQGRG
jgi:PHD/YefM family antitoxin component YafN of YafNO toxin-antitoxin module